MSQDYIYGIDFGGTNLRIGKVDANTGALMEPVFKHPMAQIASDREIKEIIMANIPSGASVGISAAGYVDEENLIITQSPNSSFKGELHFGADLKVQGFSVAITNRVRAAAQAAAKFGEGKGYRNVLAAIYSSGFNCAVVRDGKNVTNAEFGHMPYRPEDNLMCGCGGIGHLETFVSGSGAAQMARRYLSGITSESHPILVLTRENTGAPPCEIIEAITSDYVYGAFRTCPEVEPQKSIRERQVRAIADSFGMMNSAFNPLDIMVLFGDQTNHWDTLFKPAISKYHEEILQLPTLALPKIVRTDLPEICVQGAAAYFLQKPF